MSERLFFEVGVPFEVVPQVGVSNHSRANSRVGVPSVGVALQDVGVGKRAAAAPTVVSQACPVA
jgi:hypothetical protein